MHQLRFNLHSLQSIQEYVYELEVNHCKKSIVQVLSQSRIHLFKRAWILVTLSKPKYNNFKLNWTNIKRELINGDKSCTVDILQWFISS